MRDVVVCDDNLNVLRSLADGSVDLVYTDPPFGTGERQEMRRTRVHQAPDGRIGFAERRYATEEVSTMAYDDTMTFDDYLAFLFVRIKEMHRVLSDRGSLYLHLDFRAVHYARLLLDEVFGAERFLNEIIWAYDYGGRHRDRWPRKHDSILWYSKGAQWVFNREDIDRIPYMAPGLVGPEKAELGKLPTDVWWMTIVPTASRERTGYPTQKPLGLAERIVTASSHPGDLVADFFAGSGTTGVAAKRLGRSYLLVDQLPEAVEIARRRLAATEPREH